MEIKRQWERVRGFTSENKIDARWILREPGDDRAHGSLRIVSHPDLKPGYLRAFCSFVTSRKPKTQKEIEESIEEYQMDETELEVYSVHEHIKTNKIEYEAPLRELEERFQVKVFE
jgi:hypothetical protein